MLFRIFDTFSRRTLLLAALLLPVLLTGCGGGGGGGGGNPGGGTATVKGKVLLTSTNAAPASPATISTTGIAGIQTSTQSPGTFTYTGVPVANTTITVSVPFTDGNNQAQTASRVVAVKLTANGTLDLGEVYISTEGNTATLTGRIVTTSNNQTIGVGGADVTVAGVTVKSQAGVVATTGNFQIDNLPIGLGDIAGTLIGTVKATGFEIKQLTPENVGGALGSGVNPAGNILISQASGNVPLPPQTISGVATVLSTAQSGVQITLLSNGVQVGRTSTDASSTYFFWVVPGTYVVRASLPGFTTKETTVTLNRLDTPVVAPAVNLVR